MKILFLLPAILILKSCAPVSPSRIATNSNDPLQGTWVHKGRSDVTVTSYDGRGNVHVKQRSGSNLKKGHASYILKPSGLLQEIDSKRYETKKRYGGSMTTFLSVQDRSTYSKVKFIRDGFFKKSIVSSPVYRPGTTFEMYRFSKTPLSDPFEAMAWADADEHLRARRKKQ